MKTWYRNEAQRQRVNKITNPWTIEKWGEFSKLFWAKNPGMMTIRPKTAIDDAVVFEVAKKTARSKWVRLNDGDRVYFRQGDKWQECFVVAKLDQKQSPSGTWTVCVEWYAEGGKEKAWMDAGLVYSRITESCAA